MFELLPSSRTGIDFVNHLTESDSLNILNYIYYYNGGGVAIADFNNDGLEDIFFTGNETSCRLYLNLGNFKFRDVTKEAGLETTAWCTGAAIVDINGDGWLDIYVCTAGHPEAERRRNLLFINNGGLPPAPSEGGGGVTPPPPSEGAGGRLTFTEMAEAYGIADTSHSTHAAFFDYDLDGDLDLYVMNHANERAALNTPLPKKTNGEGSSNDRIYRNDTPADGGRPVFTDVTREAGILTEGYGLGVAIHDFNGDGWPDIYIANDFIYNDLLYINNGISPQRGGVGEVNFTNRISDYIRCQTYNGMGCDVADFNNDGRPGLIVVDMLPATDFDQKMMAGSMTWNKWQLIEQAGYEPQYMRNSLQWAVGNGQFAEIGQLAGVAATDWSWAPLFADFDNDGWKDLFITNGYLRDITDRDFMDYSNNLTMFKSPEEADRELLPTIRQLKGKKPPNAIFKNNRDLTFSPKQEEWGMVAPSFSNGAAYADLDGDGDLDLVVNNINGPAFIFENKADKLLTNNYLTVRLNGLPGNGEGIGASVSIVSEGQRQYLEQYRSRGFMSSVSGLLHFGLGKMQAIDTLEVRWANGHTQVLTGVPANQILTLAQTDAQPFLQKEKPAQVAAVMEDVTGQFGIDFTHKELGFNDFQNQPLLPHGFSNNGPPIAVGDLNGDGLEDFYIGGGKGQPGRIFYQNPDGNFTKKDLTEGSESEDTDALIFDANGDGKNDLYVVSGSSPFYQDRLYLNDGKGNLIWAKNALPAMPTPGTCVAAIDYDGDGDLDLFVGGSAVPGSYPLPTRSYLLRNEGGRFSDVTKEVAPGLEAPGIVTAAQWADLDGDGLPELVLVGEWMPITIFKYMDGKLIPSREIGTGYPFPRNRDRLSLIPNSEGWWNALAISDLDGDGDLDFVAGNLGLNTRFRASEEAPLTIYAKDFDLNGSVDAVLCRLVDGKEKPIHQRDDLLAQVNVLERKYPRYALYAPASVQDIFGEKALADAYRRECKVLQHACFINEGGHFRMKPLPILAQAAPVHAVLPIVIRAGGGADILLGSNSAAQHFSTGGQCASFGLMLQGNGMGDFQPVEVAQGGFFVDGAVAALAAVDLKSGMKLILAGVNNGQLRVFRLPSRRKDIVPEVAR